SMARKFFPDENPIGQHFGFELGGGLNIRPKTGDIQIVGVAGDVRPDLWRQEWVGGFYLSFNQAPARAVGPGPYLRLAVRGAGRCGHLTPLEPPRGEISRESPAASQHQDASRRDE